MKKLFNELKFCKICGAEFETNNQCCSHLRAKHNLSIKEYIEQFFDVPICKYCNKENVQVYPQPLGAATRNGGSFWKKYCYNKECISKNVKEVQINYWSKNEEAKNAARKRRVEFLKKKTGKTAWERRQNGEMSYLEQWFYDECIQKYKLNEKFDIVNEYCEFPYFIDFAFTNIKVAVELDGRCHFIHGESRKEHDKIKDKHLLEKGWNVFRIGYTENNQQTVDEFLSYISNFNSEGKQLTNRLYLYHENEVKKLKKKKRNWNQYLQDDYKKRYELNKPCIDLIKQSEINFLQRGWVSQVAILLNKKHQHVRKWMKLYLPEIKVK